MRDSSPLLSSLSSPSCSLLFHAGLCSPYLFHLNFSPSLSLPFVSPQTTSSLCVLSHHEAEIVTSFLAHPFLISAHRFSLSLVVLQLHGICQTHPHRSAGGREKIIWRGPPRRPGRPIAFCRAHSYADTPDSDFAAGEPTQVRLFCYALQMERERL